MALILRSLRVPEDVWRAAMTKAHAENTTLSKVVVAFLRRYVARKGV